MQIDSHQHFWTYRPAEYPWISEDMALLRRNFHPADLDASAQTCGIDASIAVQARQCLEETQSLLDWAEQGNRIAGVVGWLDLRSDRLESQLQTFAARRKLVGLRHVLQDEPDEAFALQPAFIRGLSLLDPFGLAYDILIYPKHLPVAIQLAAALPRQRFVLDHLAKPSVKTGSLSPWREQLIELGRARNVYCKLSGLVTEAAWKQWTASQFQPYLETALEAFGEDRLMFGSDWPVCLVSASYRQVFDLVDQFLRRLPESARKKILGENAARFYRLPQSGQ